MSLIGVPSDLLSLYLNLLTLDSLSASVKLVIPIRESSRDTPLR